MTNCVAYGPVTLIDAAAGEPRNVNGAGYFAPFGVLVEKLDDETSQLTSISLRFGAYHPPIHPLPTPLRCSGRVSFSPE